MIKFGGAEGAPLIVPIEGRRYDAVKLELPRGKPRHLAFAEFQAWSNEEGVGWRNQARRGDAKQSSVARDAAGPETSANGAITVDGGSATRAEKNPWWLVEFSDSTELEYLVLYDRIAPFRLAGQNFRISGRNTGSWETIFDQNDATHVDLVTSSTLQRSSARLGAVLRHAAHPVVVPHSDPLGEVLSAHTIAPAWAERERIRRLHSTVTALLDAFRSPAGVTSDLLRLVRTAAYGCQSQEELGASSYVWYLDVADFEALEVRYPRNVGRIPTMQLTEVDKLLPGDASFDSSDAFNRWTGRFKRGKTFATDHRYYALQIDGTGLKYHATKWELWGRRSDGTKALVYDSSIVSEVMIELVAVLRTLGLWDFESLQLLMNILEQQRRYGVAGAVSRFFDVDEPDSETFLRSMNSVEVRSAIDANRKVVARTKHGYRSTFKFKDRPRWADGTAEIIDFLREDKRFATVFPAYGTLLGFVREADFIAHDDDADVMILSDAEGWDEMLDQYEELWAYLEGHGFQLYAGGRHLPGHNLPLGFFVQNEWVHVDIFFSYRDSGTTRIFDVKTDTFPAIDPGLLDLGRSIEVFGRSFEIPQRSEELLEFWYGPDWRTPYDPMRRGYSWQVKKK